MGASGDFASKARAASRTINRDVTREVAMSASLNWMCCKILFKMFSLVFDSFRYSSIKYVDYTQDCH